MVIFEHAVGKGATEMFRKLHGTGIEECIPHLAIGRVVEQRDGNTYAHDEFLINNYVYKLGKDFVRPQLSLVATTADGTRYRGRRAS